MAAKEKKGEPFPFVIVGLSVLAVAWQFGHLWLAVAVLAVLIVLPLAPVLLGVLLMAAGILVASFCGVMYTLALFFWQRVLRRA